MNSIALELSDDWAEIQCKCDLGAPHYRYERVDCGTVSLDHGTSGVDLKKSWIGMGQYSNHAIQPHRSALAAIKKLDNLFPVSDEFKRCEEYKTKQWIRIDSRKQITSSPVTY